MTVDDVLCLIHRVRICIWIEVPNRHSLNTRAGLHDWIVATVRVPTWILNILSKWSFDDTSTKQALLKRHKAKVLRSVRLRDLIVNLTLHLLSGFFSRFVDS